MEGQGKGTGPRISNSHIFTKLKSIMGSAPVDDKMKTRQKKLSESGFYKVV
jgi:hypothetical protein